MTLVKPSKSVHKPQPKLPRSGGCLSEVLSKLAYKRLQIIYYCFDGKFKIEAHPAGYWQETKQFHMAVWLQLTGVSKLYGNSLQKMCNEPEVLVTT